MEFIPQQLQPTLMCLGYTCSSTRYIDRHLSVENFILLLLCMLESQDLKKL